MTFYQWIFGRGQLYSRLEDFRSTALFAKVPFICYVEVNSNPRIEYKAGDASPPPDNEQKLRHSVYSALAYGVKGIEWFGSGWMAQYNQCLKDVAAINSELKVLGPTLSNFAQ